MILLASECDITSPILSSFSIFAMSRATGGFFVRLDCVSRSLTCAMHPR
jgi:hypothetical protein